MSMVHLEQSMGMLPEEKLMEPCVPFTQIPMDLMGQFHVNNMTK